MPDFVPSDEYKWKWMHVRGDNPCLEVSYYSKRNLVQGDKIESSNFILSNGEVPQPGDACFCGHCKQPSYPGVQTVQMPRDDIEA